MNLHSLRTRLIVACVSIVVLSLLALGTGSYLTARNSELEDLELRMGQLADSSAQTIGEWVQAKARVVGSLKAALAEPDAKPFLNAANEAGGFAKAYIGRADKTHLSLTQVPAGYDPTARPWYRQAAAARAPVLTPPYLDVTTHKLVVTFADPLIEAGQVAAVAGADVALDSVVRIVGSIKPTPASYAFLIARDGTLISHPDAALSLKPVATLDAALSAPQLEALEKSQAMGHAAIAGRDVLLLVHAVAGTDWLLVIAVDEAEATVSLQKILRLAIAATLVSSLLGAALLARAISLRLRRLDLIRNALAESGEGDITRRLGRFGRDELGQMGNSFDRFADKTTAMLKAIRRASDSVNVSAEAIAAGNADLSRRTETQAGSIEATASAMEQLTATVKQNADSAQQANALAASASDVATQGGEVVGQMVETMGSINASARKIVDIIAVIDSIAFQTNILALNAAVEAARAGEQGRGFAVVASEVRSLAQRSAAAAKQVKHLIDDSVARVDSGSRLVERAGATIAEVVTSVKRVTDIVAEISHASLEQSAGIELVNEAIGRMDEAARQNAVLVEEAAATAQSLRGEAETLTRVVGVFKLDESVA